MLSQAVLIFLMMLAACGALVLGILELIWPTRRARRRLAGPPRRPDQRPATAPSGAVSPSSASEVAAPPARRAPSIAPPEPAPDAAPDVTIDADALSSEIGQLTASAIRASQHGDAWDAVSSLERAETLLLEAGVALPPDRREEVNRRFWLAYTKVGTRRVESSEFEEALDPLLRALRYAGDDPGRREEPVAALVEALGHVVERRSSRIREMAESADRTSARAEARTLSDLVERVLAAGVSEELLADVLTSVRELAAPLEQDG